MWYAKGSSVLPASGGALRPSMPSPISLAPWMAYRPTSLPARRSTCKTWVMARDVLVDAGFVVALLSSRALLVAFELADSVEPVVRLIEKYSDVPMSLADACLVRMTETLADPVILTTDQDVRVYRRHSRQVVPCVTPVRSRSTCQR